MLLFKQNSYLQKCFVSHLHNVNKLSPSWETVSYSSNQEILCTVSNPRIHYCIHKRHVNWASCCRGMVYLHVSDGGESFHVVMSKMNKPLQTARRGGPPIWSLSEGLTSSHQYVLKCCIGSQTLFLSAWRIFHCFRSVEINICLL